jgi:tryptophan synthase alpha chain
MSAAPAAAPARIMAHMVAFFPDKSRSLEVARGLAEGGCAYLELQFPFSDPTADGPDIQRACSAALAAGFTVDAGFQLAAEICRIVKVPVFLMSYANLLFTRGIRPFLASAAASGVRAVIVPDLPPDYDEGLFQAATEMELAAVSVLSPSMRDERLKRVSALGAE